MPVVSIDSQPKDVNAAYRPVPFTITVTGLPPVVYCDIYFNGTYYKTISKTQPNTYTGNTQWYFDIQDACQEFLKKTIPANGVSQIISIADSLSQFYCKFRCATINSDGFIESENTAPIQGTATTAPTSGDGTQSDTFSIINAVIQHHENQDLLTHLTYMPSWTADWSDGVYPLTRRKRYKVCAGDTDVFGILSNIIPDCIVLNYRIKGQSDYTETICAGGGGGVITCTGVSVGAYTIPSATNRTPYSKIIPLLGHAPFAIDNTTGLPGGVTATIDTGDNFSIQSQLITGSPGSEQYQVIFSGTPQVGDAIHMNLNLTGTSESGTQIINSTMSSGQTQLQFIEDVTNQLLTGLAALDGIGFSTDDHTITIGCNIVNSANTTVTILNSGATLHISGTPTEDSDMAGVHIIVSNCSDVHTIDIHGTPTVCVHAGLGGFVLGDATVGVVYTGSITISGTEPITISSIVKPSWATLTQVGTTGVVNVTGTPTSGDVVGATTISFHTSNCDGAGLYNFSHSIAVKEPAANGNGSVHNGVSGFNLQQVTLAGTNCTPYTGFPIPNGSNGTCSIPYEVNGHLAVRFNTQPLPSSLTLEIIINGSTVESDVHSPSASPVITSTNAYTIHSGDTVQINVF